MRRYLLFPVALIMLLITPAAMATEILAVDVQVDGDVYRLHGESIINAPADFIFDILTDYDNFHRISRGIAETRFLEPGEDGTLFGYTRIDSCVWFFCRQFEKVEQIRTIAPTQITTEVIPDQSDFNINKTQWSLTSVEGGTLVKYDAEMDPDFWIPPLIGPWALKNKLQSSAEQIGVRIEYLLSTGRPLSSYER